MKEILVLRLQIYKCIVGSGMKCIGGMADMRVNFWSRCYKGHFLIVSMLILKFFQGMFY